MKRSPSFQVKLSPPLEDILAPAYKPCAEFNPQGACHGEMRWRPDSGHVPRGFLGACGEPSEVELILVFAEPGDPHGEELDSEHTRLLNSAGTAINSVYEYATWAVETGRDQFHRNLNDILTMCWPGSSFEQQMQKVWLTDSVLCSAIVEGGRVSPRAAKSCGRHYLLRQRALFREALLVAVGGKAKQRLLWLDLREGPDFIHVRSIAPPRVDPRARGSRGRKFLGACPRNSGFWWRRLRESDSACL